MPHTQGPWFAKFSPHHDGSFDIVDKAGGRDAGESVPIIEGGYCVLAQRAPWPHRAAESEANACLMAASPEMRDALEEAEELVDRIYDGAPDSPTHWMGKTLENIRAAIAKSKRPITQDDQRKT